MIGKLGLGNVAKNFSVTKKNAPTAASQAPEQSKQAGPSDGVSISGAADQPVDAKKLGIGAALATAAGVGITAAAAAVASPLVIPALMFTMVSGTVSYASLKTLGDEAPQQAKQGVADVGQAPGNTNVQALNGDTQKPLVMLDEPKTGTP